VNNTTRPDKAPPPTRTPKYTFGQTLEGQHGFVGRVDAMYADLYAAQDCFAVPEGWWDQLEKRPSTKDQIFYSLIAMDGEGAVLAGEAEARPR
jgi:heat shock protein HspQ